MFQNIPFFGIIIKNMTKKESSDRLKPNKRSSGFTITKSINEWGIFSIRTGLICAIYRDKRYFRRRIRGKIKAVFSGHKTKINKKKSWSEQTIKALMCFLCPFSKRTHLIWGTASKRTRLSWRWSNAIRTRFCLEVSPYLLLVIRVQDNSPPIPWPCRPD